MSAVLKRLMRCGRVEEGLSAGLRAAMGPLRSDLVRFGVGQECQSAIRVEGSAMIVEVQGRHRRCVALQVLKRLQAPLVGQIEEGRDMICVRIEEELI